MRALALCSLALAAGCADAAFVEKRRRVYGPVAAVGLIDAGGGRLRYALRGPKSLVDRRRRRAFAKMAKYCEGPELYRVLKEYTQEDSETPYASSDLDSDKLLGEGHYRINSYRHIVFDCVKK